MKTPKGYFTLKEASKRLGVTYRAVSGWVKEKRLRSIKPGKERFVLISEVEGVENGR